VRLDEHENPTTNTGGIIISAFPHTYSILPPASSIPTPSGLFPPLSSSGDVAGWMYLNLTTNVSTNASRPSQNWITPVMYAEGRYQTAYDATPLGNGCSSSAAVTDYYGRYVAIGPASNTTP